VLIAGRKVQITNPDKVFFPVAGFTKGDLLDYYLAVAEGAVRAVANRPMALKRFVQGAEGEAFFQKRAPANRPPGSRRRCSAFARCMAGRFCRASAASAQGAMVLAQGVEP
jgi:DNA primase